MMHRTKDVIIFYLIKAVILTVGVGMLLGVIYMLHIRCVC